MYSIEEYNKLVSKYGSYSSWAIWDYNNANDTSIIDRNFKKLNSKYVLLGLNISRLLGEPAWSNFHDNTHARKLKYACNDTKLRGCYITDLFKDIPQPVASKLKISLTDEQIRKNMSFFNQEMKNIQIDDKTKFIVLGELAKNYFNKYFKQEYTNRVIYHRHYSSRGTDKEWVTSFWKILSINSEFDTTVSRYFNKK